MNRLPISANASANVLARRLPSHGAVACALHAGDESKRYIDN